MIAISKEQEISQALINGNTALNEWLQKNAPEEIQELFNKCGSLQIFKLSADYVGYTKPGSKRAIETAKEINTLLQMI